jgi:hypothetical protein
MKILVIWVEDVKTYGDEDVECDEVERKMEDAAMFEESGDSSGIRTLNYMFHSNRNCWMGVMRRLSSLNRVRGEAHDHKLNALKRRVQQY